MFFTVYKWCLRDYAEVDVTISIVLLLFSGYCFQECGKCRAAELDSGQGITFKCR